MSPACQLTTVCVHRAGQRALVASGGRGGRGNLAFKSARNTAPALAEFGEKVRGGMRGGLGWSAGGGEMCRVDGGTGKCRGDGVMGKCRAVCCPPGTASMTPALAASGTQADMVAAFKLGCAGPGDMD